MKKLGIAVLIAAMLALPMSALALEKMSGEDLGGVVGQAGVTIAFGGTSTTTISFSQVNWGDPDGLASSACANNAGWIIIDGGIVIEQVIACGETLTMDIGTTGAGTCTIATPCSVDIPGATTFIAVGLPAMTLSISVPQTLTIGLGNAAGTITGTLGILNLVNLNVDSGTPDVLYIWAH